MITVEYLRECFEMDADTGKLTWKVRPVSHFKTIRRWKSWNAVYAGKRTGYVDKDGYEQCGIQSKLYGAHWICWALAHGTLPTKTLDHIDGNRANNVASNLRECTRSENMMNSRQRANPTGRKGVSRSGSRFYAKICVNKEKIFLGSFLTADEAYAAYCEAALKHHGEFANLGTPIDPKEPAK